MVEDDEDENWPHDVLPLVLRYRRNPLRWAWISVGLLILAAPIAAVLIGHWVFAALPLLFALTLTTFAFPIVRSMRKLDFLRVEPHALVLAYRDGRSERLPLTPSVEFAISTDHPCDMLVMTTAADHHARRRTIAFDLLDLPPDHSLHDLCDLLNHIGASAEVAPAGPWGQRVAAQPTVRRRWAWYYDPGRISREGYILGALGVLALCVGVFLGLTEVLALLGFGAEQMTGALAKLALGLAVAHPLMKFLNVARLRDLGEAANHRNVGGLLWKTTAGPLHLFIARGEDGPNHFGPQPRF